MFGSFNACLHLDVATFLHSRLICSTLVMEQARRLSKRVEDVQKRGEKGSKGNGRTGRKGSWCCTAVWWLLLSLPFAVCSICVCSVAFCLRLHLQLCFCRPGTSLEWPWMELFSLGSRTTYLVVLRLPQPVSP